MKKSFKPLVSVIIATKNEAKNITRLLDSIGRQTYPRIETIVVDNYSTDDTVQKVSRFTKKVYQFGNERSSQRNFGAYKSHGQFLLFLDADMQLPTSVVRECFNAIKKKGVAAVIIPEDTPHISFFGRIKSLEKRIYWNEPVVEAARFYKKNVFVSAGGYNQRLVSGEDWDLSNRIAIQWRLTRTTTPLWHYEISFWRELRHKWYYANNITAYARLHPQSFSLQSGMTRLRLFWRKKRLLLAEPLTASGLIVIKSLEYIIYVAARWLTR